MRLGLGIRTLLQRRALLGQFFWREVRNRYLGSVSGVFWALFHPLVLLAVYSLVFTAIFRVRFPELEGRGFVAFAAVALWPWLALQESVQRATTVLQGNGQLIRKVAFPHELLVYASVGATYGVHLTGFLVILIALHVFGASLHLGALPAVTVLLLVQFILSLGLGLMLASVQVFLRDVEHVLPPLFMIAFYLSPILYPVSLVPEALRGVIYANPYTYFAERLRRLLFDGTWPWGWRDAAMVLGVLLFLWAVRRLFLRLSPHFEDFL